MRTAAVPVLLRAAIAAALVLTSLPLSVVAPAGTPLAPPRALAATVTGDTFDSGGGCGVGQQIWSNAACWNGGAGPAPVAGDDVVLVGVGGTSTADLGVQLAMVTPARP